jgi:hypothetical protein
MGGYLDGHLARSGAVNDLPRRRHRPPSQGARGWRRGHVAVGLWARLLPPTRQRRRHSEASCCEFRVGFRVHLLGRSGWLRWDFGRTKAITSTFMTGTHSTGRLTTGGHKLGEQRRSDGVRPMLRAIQPAMLTQMLMHPMSICRSITKSTCISRCGSMPVPHPHPHPHPQPRMYQSLQTFHRGAMHRRETLNFQRNWALSARGRTGPW